MLWSLVNVDVVVVIIVAVALAVVVVIVFLSFSLCVVVAASLMIDRARAPCSHIMIKGVFRQIYDFFLILSFFVFVLF